MGLLGIVLVIVLIILFFSFPKQMLFIVVGLIFITIVLWWVYIEAPQKQRDVLSQRVGVSVVYSLSSCNNSQPLLINIKNNSSKTVKKVEWRIGIYIPGHSTDIAGFENSYSCDKILKPGGVLTSCYQLPPRMKDSNQDFGSLRYVISSKYVYFED